MQDALIDLHQLSSCMFQHGRIFIGSVAVGHGCPCWFRVAERSWEEGSLSCDIRFGHNLSPVVDTLGNE